MKSDDTKGIYRKSIYKKENKDLMHFYTKIKGYRKRNSFTKKVFSFHSWKLWETSKSNQGIRKRHVLDSGRFCKTKFFFQNQEKKENLLYKTSTNCENIARKGICNTEGETLLRISKSFFAKNRLITNYFSRTK